MADELTRWRIRDDVAWIDEGTRIALLPLADPKAEPLALEGSAAEIWRVMVRLGAADPKLVISEVAEAFLVEEDVVDDAVRTFVRTMAEHSLVAVDTGVEPTR